MNDITQILQAIGQGDAEASQQLLPLVYEELRKIANNKMAHQNPGHTLGPTALVHEVYLRLFGTSSELSWDNRRHFFATAAQAMRQILIDNARRKQSAKHGGDKKIRSLEFEQVATPEIQEDIVALDEALEQLSESKPKVAELVKLRYFAGLTNKQSAELLNISPRTADSWWAYARAWIHKSLTDDTTE